MFICIYNFITSLRDSPKKSRSGLQEDKALLKLRACLSCRMLKSESEVCIKNSNKIK